MKTRQLKSNKPRKSLLSRLFFLVIFIVLLPLFLISKMFSLISGSRKRRRWDSSVKSGENIILSSNITSIDLMEGFEFEFFLSSLFFYMGYEVKTTAKRGDFGADLIVTNHEGSAVLQAKRYSKNVGSRSVQEVLVAKRHYKTDHAIVVTNSMFTDQAEQVARENGVRLIDRNELAEMLVSVQNVLTENSSKNRITVDFAEKSQFEI